MMLRFYRWLSVLATPLIALFVCFRKFYGKEDAIRFRERFGCPSLARPDGVLIWVHAASVGESLSMLPLIGRLVVKNPELNILVTTGTVTSARLMGERLPERTFHQFIPIDQVLFVRRFLDHWRPDLALWAESEFWPNIVTESASRDISMVLINGRVSSRSFAGWRRFDGLIKTLLGCFDLCLGQSNDDVRRLRQMGANSAKYVGNLKFSGLSLPVDKAELLEMKKIIGPRPIWLAASTHTGEEKILLEAHQRLKVLHTNLLTIIIPRNSKRGEKIATKISKQGFEVALRSDGDSIATKTEIYVADTMGEMGLFFQLAEVVFIGKSLVPLGGQNPLEAARLGCAIVYGPHMKNFEDISIRLEKANAAIQVLNTEGLIVATQGLLKDISQREMMAAAAKAFAANEVGVLDAVITELKPFIDHLLYKDKSRAHA